MAVLMATLLAGALGVGEQPTITGISPTRIGPLGGASIIVSFAADQGPRLRPVRERRLRSTDSGIARGLAQVRVGGVLCEHDPAHSTPSGSQIACLAPQMPPGSYAVTVHSHDDVDAISTSPQGASCTSCVITYAHDLVVNASLELHSMQSNAYAKQLSTVDVATGDSVFLLLEGAHELVDPSQLSVHFGQPKPASVVAGALPRAHLTMSPTAAPTWPDEYYTVLRPLQDDGARGRWTLQTRIPATLRAGEHMMEVHIERPSPTHPCAHGRASFSNGFEARMPATVHSGTVPSIGTSRTSIVAETSHLKIRVHPVIERLSTHRAGLNGGTILTISGGGFSQTAAHNHVVMQASGVGGATLCDVIMADAHRIVCVLSTPLQAGDKASEGAATPARQTGTRLAHGAGTEPFVPVDNAPMPTDPAMWQVSRLNASRAADCLKSLGHDAPALLDRLIACSQAVKRGEGAKIARAANAAILVRPGEATLDRHEGGPAVQPLGVDPDVPQPLATNGVDSVPVRHEMQWPSVHPLGIDDSSFRQDAFVASSIATLRVPVRGVYSFRLLCGKLHSENLCESTLRVSQHVALHTNPTQSFEVERRALDNPDVSRSSERAFQPESPDDVVDLMAATPMPLALDPEREYELRVRFAHLEHGDHIRLAVNVSTLAHPCLVTVNQARGKLPAPLMMRRPS